MDHPTDVRVQTLCNIFTNNKIKQRVESFISSEFFAGGNAKKSPMMKGLRRTLSRFATAEYAHMKANLRFSQRRPNKKRSSSKRVSTKYTLFCKEMKEKYGVVEMAGKLQRLWSEKNGRPPKEKPVEPVLAKNMEDTDSSDDSDDFECHHDQGWYYADDKKEIARCMLCDIVHTVIFLKENKGIEPIVLENKYKAVDMGTVTEVIDLNKL